MSAPPAVLVQPPPPAAKVTAPVPLPPALPTVKLAPVAALIGAPVTRHGAEIGIVTAAAWSPYLGCGIGYVRLADADLVDPRTADVVGRDLATHACAIVDLPFYDAEKKIPRSLEAAAI